MSIPFVDLHRQYLAIKKEIDDAFSSVIARTAFVGGAGNKYVFDFENAFASYLGVEHCVSCANGTDSLEILLKCYGIGPGDEVIVPALSWISTSEAVSNVGARPVFVDVHPQYFTIDPSKIESAISSFTRAIIPVHLYGLPAEMDEIVAIAQRLKLIIVEDCAQAHGAEYKGRKVGTIGHAASFSFYPGKNLGAFGDAGCMVTNEPEVAERARMISNHGQKGKHNHLIEGRNSRMDGVQAALLSVKLKYLDQWNNMRIKNADSYKELLSGSDYIFQGTPTYSRHVYHIFSLMISERDKLILHLKANDISAAVHYPTALPFLPAYARFSLRISDYPVAYEVSSKLVSIPMFPELSTSEIGCVVSALKSFIK